MLVMADVATLSDPPADVVIEGEVGGLARAIDKDCSCAPVCAKLVSRGSTWTS
jgi:hypothetical protein